MRMMSSEQRNATRRAALADRADTVRRIEELRDELRAIAEVAHAEGLIDDAEYARQLREANRL